MIDYFALALAHGLLVIAFFRLVSDDGLDSEGGEANRVSRRGRGQDDAA